MPVQQNSISIGGAAIGGNLVNGSVDVSLSTPNRVASMTFVDSSLSLDAAAAGTWIGDEVSATVNGQLVFLGPISTLVMSDRIVQIEAIDRSAYGLDPSLVVEASTYTAGGSHSISNAIGVLMAAMGVSYSNSSGLGSRILQNTLVMERGAEYWVLASELASSLGGFMLMTRSGAAELKAFATSVGTSFTEADDIVSQPAIGFDLIGSGFRNYVDAVGLAACSDEVWHTTASASGALSPASIGRYLVQELDSEDVIDEDELQTDADALVAALSAYTATSNFEINLMGNEQLEPGMLAGTPFGDVRITNFTIPLDGTSTMSVGVNKRIHSKGYKADWRR